MLNECDSKYKMYITSSTTENKREQFIHNYRAGEYNTYIVKLTRKKKQFTKKDLVDYIAKLDYMYKYYKEDMKKEWFYPRILMVEDNLEKIARAIVCLKTIIHFHLEDTEDENITLEYIASDITL